MRRLIVSAIIIQTAVLLPVTNSFGSLRQLKATTASSNRSLKKSPAKAPSLSISPNSISAPSDGKSGTLSVITKKGTKLNVTSVHSWLTVTTQIGQENKLTYSVDSNPSAAARTGTILINDQQVTVTQAGALPVSFSSFSSPVTFAAAGGNSTVQLAVTGSSGWSVRSNAKWITNVSPTNGVGNATISYSVTTNLSCDSRSNSIVLMDENSVVQQTLTINQAAGAGNFSLSANTMTFAASGGSDSIYLTTGSTCIWRTQTDANWITTLSSTNGTGSAYLTFSVGENPSCASRSASVNILDANSAVRGTVTITQAGSPASYSLGSAYLIFTAAGGNVSVGLTATCSWTVQTDVSWINNISPMSGNGNATINYTVAPNTTSGSRTGKIKILDGNSVVQQTLNITQGGGTASYAISYTSATFTAAASSSNFVLTANSSWNILTDVDWISGVSSMTGSGNATLTYTILANTNSASRTASIKVLDGNFAVQQTLTITQNGSAAADSSSGQYRWSSTLGTIGNDSGHSVATDSQGNVLVTGNLDNSIFIEKYSSAGTFLWSKNLEGTGSGKAITVDQNDNVLVAGTFSSSIDFGGGLLSSVSNNDLFVAKYSSSGEHIWSKNFGGIEGDDSARSMAVDSTGNVLIAGNANIENGQEIFLAKFSATGSHLWSKQFSGTMRDSGNGVAIDASGDIVLIGMLTNANTLSGDTFLAKFDGNGSPLWSEIIDDQANALGLDHQGNILLLGSAQLAKYSPQGAALWVKQLGSADGAYEARSVTVDSQDNIVATGRFFGTVDFGGGPQTNSGNGDTFLISFAP